MLRWFNDKLSFIYSSALLLLKDYFKTWDMCVSYYSLIEDNNMCVCIVFRNMTFSMLKCHYIDTEREYVVII